MVNNCNSAPTSSVILGANWTAFSLDFIDVLFWNQIFAQIADISWLIFVVNNCNSAPTSSVILGANWTAFSLDFKRIVTQGLGTANYRAIACLEFSTQAVSAFTETPDLTLFVHLSCQRVSTLRCLFEIKIKIMK